MGKFFKGLARFVHVRLSIPLSAISFVLSKKHALLFLRLAQFRRVGVLRRIQPDRHRSTIGYCTANHDDTEGAANGCR